MNKNSVIVYSQLPPPRHGSAIMTQTLVNILGQRGYRVHVIERRFSKSSDQVGKSPFRKLFKIPSLLVRAATQAKGAKSVVFFTTNRPGSFLVDCAVRQIFRLRGLPVVHYVHTFGYAALGSRGRVWSALTDSLFRRSARIVVLSGVHALDLQAHAAGVPITVIANASAELIANPNGGFESDSPRFVYFSTISVEKGVQDFIAVARAIGRSHMNARFEIYGAWGDGVSERKVLREAEKLPQLHYMGEARTRDEKAKALHGALALIFATQYEYEAQPMAIIEAFSVGTPVLTYAKGAIPELLSQGGGVVVNDVNALTDAARALISEAKLVTRLRLEARQVYVSRHSVDAYGDDWDRVLNEIKV